MAGVRIPPEAEREAPFAGLCAKGPAQRHCHGIAEGLHLPAEFGSARLHHQILVPPRGHVPPPCGHVCFCIHPALIEVNRSPGKKKKGHGSPGVTGQLKYSLVMDKMEPASPEQRACTFAYTSSTEHLCLCSAPLRPSSFPCCLRPGPYPKHAFPPPFLGAISTGVVRGSPPPMPLACGHPPSPPEVVLGGGGVIATATHG